MKTGTAHLRIIGKFFGGVPHLDPEAALHRMEREYNNLCHCAVSALPVIRITLFVLLAEMPISIRCWSRNTVMPHRSAEFIVRAIRKGERDALFQKLTVARLFSRHVAQSHGAR